MCFPALLAALPAGAAAAGGIGAGAAATGAVAGTAAAAGGLSTLQILGLGATALGAASSVVQGVAGLQAGRTNAKLAKREGIIAQQRAAFEQGDIAREQRALAGRQAVAAAKSGRTFSGSVIDVVSGSSADAELDVLSSVYGGVLGAQSARFQAKQARAQGRAALFGGIAGGATTLLTGGVRAFG